MTLEWDARKAAATLKKHKVTLRDAATVFLDPLAMTFPDPDHSSNERREITIGYTLEEQVLLVSHCDVSGRLRIISARRVTRREKQDYE